MDAYPYIGNHKVVQRQRIALSRWRIKLGSILNGFNRMKPFIERDFNFVFWSIFKNSTTSIRVLEDARSKKRSNIGTCIRGEKSLKKRGCPSRKKEIT